MLKNKEKKEKKTKKEHEEKNNKFLEIIKKRWLINGSKTLLLVVIILGIFIGITMCMQKLDLTPIDLTEQKLFTLTEESKEQIRNINFDNSNVNIYFVGYSEDDSTLDLARQYTKVTDKISVEAVTANDRPDLIDKICDAAINLEDEEFINDLEVIKKVIKKEINEINLMEIKSLGELFNPELHKCLAVEKNKSKVENQIISVVRGIYGKNNTQT